MAGSGRHAGCEDNVERVADRALPFVSVVVPAHNCERTIGDCLASLLQLDYPRDRLELLVVDNASTDGTSGVISRYPVRCLQEPRRSPGAARNRGMEAGSGEIVAFTDADCVVTSGWIRELVREFEPVDVWGAVGEVAAYHPATPAERYVAMRRPRLQESLLRRRAPFPGTANVAFRRKTFETIGVFDPNLPTAEDKDFGWRFLDAGLKLSYNARALVLHRHRDSAWKLFLQFVGWGHGAALVHRKHRPPWSLRRELPDVDLPVALRNLVAVGVGYWMRGGDATDVHYHWFDLLRRVGLRMGAFYGRLEGASWGLGPRT
jgi:glycosyltransferase involved in cell wall biosynthesis